MYTSAIDVQPKDVLCVARSATEDGDAWSEVQAIEWGADKDRVVLHTALGDHYYLRSDRVTIQRPYPEDPLLSFLAEHISNWWTGNRDGTPAHLGGFDNNPDHDDWALAEYLRIKMSEFYPSLGKYPHADSDVPEGYRLFTILMAEPLADRLLYESEETQRTVSTLIESFIEDNLIP
jgi:hypothetical protein